ncbi:MAG TPA: polysaccharide biosynthesis/export family protein [Terracidiphilus sp.]|nr:polysaccharide biosynthesis/export family protein [Terracidiphilus sp.]
MLLACFVYCLAAPREYEAKARVALRIAPETELNLNETGEGYSAGFFNEQLQLETLASVFRSDRLAWRVMDEEKLYHQAAFAHGFTKRFPDFRPEAPSTAARAWLLERFQDSLRVRTIPRTLLLEIRFQTRDAALSAAVVNALIQQYQSEETETRILATAQASGWLEQQLQSLKARSDRDEVQLADFQKEHGLLVAPETLANGQPGVAEHVAPLREVDDLANELVAASSERILREAEYRAASEGDPELVLATDPRLQSEAGGLPAAAFRELRARRSALEEEDAQLTPEHGPNFPRRIEIHEQIEDLDGQLKTEDDKLRERFRGAWQTAQAREEMVRKSLEERTGAGQEASAALGQYERMRREADASHQLYVRMQDKAASAGLAAGVHGSDFWIVDPAQPPAKPSVPDPPLAFAIAGFVGIWLAMGGAFMMENLRPSRKGTLAMVCALVLGGYALRAQAPTPNTSGLPTGVTRLPQSTVTGATPNAREAPPVWNAATPGAPAAGGNLAVGELPGPIVPGDLLDVSEYHTPEFHSAVRVSAAGTVLLPMVGEVAVQGMDETTAAHAIADALVGKGILTHPQVNVLVTAFVGQDVTVAGEVARPGVYPYGVHHRLLDVIAAASGLSPEAGSVIRIVHRDAPEKPELIALDAAAGATPNPELVPGDTVEVSRAGVVYVLGDVIRPGGFTMEPAQPMTVLQAVSLAWGPTQNATVNKILLIHEQNGSRAVTTLNLKRMLRGLDPDMPIAERDILFVPDSAMKNLWNRSLESVVQSAAGVSIYAGLVYSQRF